MFETNYGEKLAYVWHQNYAAHAGKFDYRLFPEVLYTHEFKAYQNQNKAAVRMMGDKNFLPLVAKSVGVRMPRTIVSCTNGLLRDGENSIITPAMANELLKKEGTFFVKPSVDSCSGQGCVKLEMDDDYNISHNALILNKLRRLKSILLVYYPLATLVTRHLKGSMQKVKIIHCGLGNFS